MGEFGDVYLFILFLACTVLLVDNVQTVQTCRRHVGGRFASAAGVVVMTSLGDA
jgi:hypothetical protein